MSFLQLPIIKQIFLIVGIYGFVKKILDLKIEDYLDKHLYQNPKYHNSQRLNKFEFQVFSQNGEDGIIEEIFERIGVLNYFFVEFGVGNGLENNTTYLLTKKWSGIWIDGSINYVKKIQKSFHNIIANKQLKIANSFITAENIERLFSDLEVPKEFDLLSIDIDGNDYWVWKAISNYSPRVVVIEYNSTFPSHVKWVIKYDPKAIWMGNSHFNSSLKSLELLGKQKGYLLVGCNFTGCNAFFVREDLVSEKFCAPFTAENHYEPSRFYLSRRLGHERAFGDFTSI